MGDTSNSVQLQELLDQGNDGRDKAYDELLSIAAMRLQKLTRKMLSGFPQLKRWEETDDVFQTAAMRLHNSLASVRPENVRDFFGLAATQIRRTLIDLSRRHFGPRGNGSNHDSTSGPHHEAMSNSPESLAFWTEFHGRVEEIPEEDREVFCLVWYSGATYDDAAKLLKVSQRTIFRRYYRARLFLQKHLSLTEKE